jgi:two-component system LytT family response regulator
MKESNRNGGTMRTLIVDDEPLARELLRSMLEREPDIEIVGERGDGLSAIEAVGELAPDLLFLDVQMPELDGFGVIDAIDRERMPAVIFVTAYDRYAVRAFEVHALDYLLKPFDEERLERAVARARGMIGRDDERDAIDARLLALLREMRPAREYIERIAIREKTRVLLQPVREIDWLEADGKYVRVHAGSAVHTIRDGIGRLHGDLDPDRFIRISRSAIVNIDRVAELRPWFQGDYLVVLVNGRQIPSTRGYRDALQALLDGRRINAKF